MKTISANRPVEQNPVRKPALRIATAAAVAAMVIVGAVVVLDDDDKNDAGSAQAPLELSLGAGDALASCLPLDAAVMATMSPAFAATAASIEGTTVTLDVDRWYAGGEATSVALRAEAGMEALIAGFDFEVGQQYLITAAGDTVNFCGYSGPATPELAAVFDQAFTSG